MPAHAIQIDFLIEYSFLHRVDALYKHGTCHTDIIIIFHIVKWILKSPRLIVMTNIYAKEIKYWTWHDTECGSPARLLPLLSVQH